MLLQPGDLAIDYSYARPDPALIVACGVRAVLRYVSRYRDNSKNVTMGELVALWAAGLATPLVWEQSKVDALGGATLGATYGAMAGAYLRDFGHPSDVALSVACDTQLTVSTLPVALDYLRAFADTCGYPIRPYGQDTLVTAAAEAGIASGGWQTRAWSAGRLSPYADVVQEVGLSLYPQLTVLGAVDADTVLRPFEAWSDATPHSGKDDVMSERFVRKAGTGEVWEVVHDAGYTWTFHIGGPDDPGARNELLAGLFYDPATLPEWPADVLDGAPHAPRPAASSTPARGTWEATG